MVQEKILKKHRIFSVPIKSKLQELLQKGNGITRTISYRLELRFYLLKKFIKLNVDLKIMIKIIKLLEVNTKIATVFLNTQTFKIIQFIL